MPKSIFGEFILFLEKCQHFRAFRVFLLPSPLSMDKCTSPPSREKKSPNQKLENWVGPSQVCPDHLPRAHFLFTMSTRGKGGEVGPQANASTSLLTALLSGALRAFSVGSKVFHGTSPQGLPVANSKHSKSSRVIGVQRS